MRVAGDGGGGSAADWALTGARVGGGGGGGEDAERRRWNPAATARRLRGEPRTARRAKSLSRRRRQDRMERSKVAATAAGAEVRDLSGLPRRLAADRRRRRGGRGRRATGDGDGFVGVTLPAPSLGDGGGFVGVLDTIDAAACLRSWEWRRGAAAGGIGERWEGSVWVFVEEISATVGLVIHSWAAIWQFFDLRRGSNGRLGLWTTSAWT